MSIVSITSLKGVLAAKRGIYFFISYDLMIRMLGEPRYDFSKQWILSIHIVFAIGFDFYEDIMETL